MKNPRWSLLAIALAVGLGLADDPGAPSPPRPDLVGRVKTKGGGDLAKATVFISTAGPKTGSSTFCPSCYADCRKSSKTDASGKFKIESLDPQLVFRILVVAKGYKPKYVPKIDPAKGAMDVDLEPIESGEVTSDRSVRGKIVDLQGKPIYGAVVEAHGIRKKNGVGTMWGSLPGVDPLAVTDEEGEFLLTARDPFEALDLRVEARAFANKSFTKNASGTTVHKLTLTEGATITGRVVREGKPLAGVSVGMVSADRTPENYTGNFDVGTDSEGRFTFVNLPANVDYFIYGMMNSLKGYGAIPARKLRAGADGATVDAGELAVNQGQRLAGQVVLADAKPVPAKTRLLVSREGAWDSMQVVLGKEGRFDISGIPKETLSLSARVSGYRVSSRNRSFDRMNPFQIVGRVESDITNLVFLQEKGEEIRPDFGGNVADAAWPHNHPLHGAEGTSEHSEQWAVSGQVRDRETKQPLGEFRVTPGNLGGRFQAPFWDKRNATDASSGNFTAYLDKKFAQPALKLEADGYLPASVSLLPEARSNLDFTLEKGSGPSGTALLPDGEPAGGVTLALLCAGDRETRLTGEGRLRAFRNKDALQMTDPDGSFSFHPELDMEKVVVTAKEGFRMVTLAELAKNPRLVLEPWGQIKGVLHRASSLGTNETLDLAFQGDSHYFLEVHAETDAEGRFEFAQAPSGELQVNGRDFIGDGGGWRTELIEKVTLKPGQTLDVNLKAPARSVPRKDFSSSLSRSAPKPPGKSGPALTGTVLLPNGKPAADAEVALMVAGKYLSLGRGALRAEEAHAEGRAVNCGPDGRFSLPSEEAASGIVIVHEQGFAQMTLDALKQSPQVTLQAWGRIEGILHIGRRLGTNELVILEQTEFGNGEPMFDHNDFQARTDDNGRFIIAFVPPGEQKIAHLIPEGGNSWRHSPGGVFAVKAGEVTQVSVGGSGRTLIGKIQPSGLEPKTDWTHVHAAIHTPFPKSFPKGGDSKESVAWAKSAEAKSYRKISRAYPIIIQPDGSFRIEEVPPGKYEIMVMPAFAMRDEPKPKPDFPGIFRKEIIVPEAPKAGDDTPFDVGVLEGRLEPLPKPMAAKEEPSR